MIGCVEGRCHSIDRIGTGSSPYFGGAAAGNAGDRIHQRPVNIIVGRNVHAGLRGLLFIQLCQRSIVD